MSRIRLSSTGGTPNVLFHTIGNTAKAHKLTWARTQLTPWLHILGVKHTTDTSRAPVYWNRVSSVGTFMYIAGAAGGFHSLFHVRPPIWLTLGTRLFRLS
jgi:hypothetical protein